MKQRILVLAPHTDDGEFGCGATIAKFVERGADVYYIAFSTCSESLPAGLPLDTLRKEMLAATKVLGIPSDNVLLYDLPVRRFSEHRQSILEYMIKVRDRVKPTMVFLPSKDDTHQDHQVIANEGFRAFKTATMLAYEMPWNQLTFNTRAFSVLEENHLSRKIEAMKCYKSQSHRPYATAEFIRSLATVRGVQIGVKIAETFDVSRWVLQ